MQSFKHSTSTMSVANFLDSRIRETYSISKKYDGDRQQYAVAKWRQEAEKRYRQSRVTLDELHQQLERHYLRFPRWFCVRDGSDSYCSKELIMSTIKNESAKRVLHVPVRSNGDVFEVLQELMARPCWVEGIRVMCDFDATTRYIPHKCVVMTHYDGNSTFVEALKHQDRDRAPMVITDIVGCRNDGSGRVVLFTKEIGSHTRYLHRDFSRYQHHEALPHYDVPMRLGYVLFPETLKSISVFYSGLKIVIHERFDRAGLQLDATSAMFVIDNLVR